MSKIEQILLNWYITQSNELFYSIVLENDNYICTQYFESSDFLLKI